MIIVRRFSLLHGFLDSLLFWSLESLSPWFLLMSIFFNYFLYF